MVFDFEKQRFYLKVSIVVVLNIDEAFFENFGNIFSDDPDEVMMMGNSQRRYTDEKFLKLGGLIHIAMFCYEVKKKMLKSEY